MCDREDVQTLQRGMNYRLNPHYSVILMSVRRNAPYQDQIQPDGITIIYEGHDIPKDSSDRRKNPKKLDQPMFNKNGKRTQNGQFAHAVDEYKGGSRDPEIVKVYEKVFPGVWSEKGFFKLIDYVYINSGSRRVFKYTLEEVQIDMHDQVLRENKLKPRTRLIPTEIKKGVWIRDCGMCTICGAKDELHFDHELPYSKGGTSISMDNVRILCARHNLQKSDKIE